MVAVIAMLLSLALLAPVKDPVPDVTLDLPICFQMAVGDELRLALEGVSAAWLVEHLAALEVTPVAEAAAVVVGGVAVRPATPVAGPVSVRAATVPAPALVKPAVPWAEPLLAGIAPVAGVTAPAVAAPIAVVVKPGVGPNAVGPMGVDAGTVTAAGDVAIVLAKVQAGDRSGSTMTALAELPAEILVQALERPQGWEDNPAYADAVVGALLAGEYVSPLDDCLPRTSRRRIADSLARRGDEQCVAVYEALLRIQKVNPSEAWIPEVSSLAAYWARRGDHSRASAAWEYGSSLTASRRIEADYLLEAARSARAAGETQRAASMHAAVNMLGQPYFSTLACLDQARNAILDGSLAMAIEILAAPPPSALPPGEWFPVEYLAALLALRTGQASEAARRCRAALKPYEAACKRGLNPRYEEFACGLMRLSVELAASDQAEPQRQEKSE